MRHAEDLARRIGKGPAPLHEQADDPNIALYERLGFVFDTETYHDQGTVAVHMVKAVEGSPPLA
jgi:predicted GNAT family N-acyltransferase